MAVAAGTRLGVYEIIAPVGAGGMGEVFRARDTKLARDVAVKILPPAFINDRDRVARFEREARVLAALNHLHIGAIYGFHDSDDVHALVLEFVDGETLAQRIARGPISVTDALSMARQIADALDAAHEKGIVHRDLKPPNIKITPDGSIKVLDFGLAKSGGSEPAAAELTQSPTVTVGGTREGVLLGTAAYMSPEQARGFVVDKRADIWAFGCVVYEMLTGRAAFARETMSDTLAAVINAEPDWSRLPSATPPSVLRLLQRCLRKDLKRRQRDIGDVLLEFSEGAPDLSKLQPNVGPRYRGAALAGLAAAVMFGLLGAWIGRTSNSESAPLVVFRSSIGLPPNFVVDVTSTPLAISPDGSKLVYAGRADGSATTQLYLRGLGELETTPIPGTDGAAEPFFSPGGRWIAFFAAGSGLGVRPLKKVSLQDGTVTTLTASGVARGAVWTPQDQIVLTATGGEGLSRLPAAGGALSTVTTLKTDGSERSHRLPVVMPDGETILFTIVPSEAVTFAGNNLDRGQIAVWRPGMSESRVVLSGGFNARYLPTGHLIFARSGDLFAVRFDLLNLRVIGSPKRVVAGVAMDTVSGGVAHDVSKAGHLIYLPGQTAGTGRLTWIGRHGTQTLLGEPLPYTNVRLSPNGRHAAFSVSAAIAQISVIDLERGVITHVTEGGGPKGYPIWTPDSTRVTFSTTDAAGKNALAWVPIDGTGRVEVLGGGSSALVPGSWSPDGKWLAFSQTGENSRSDIWLLSSDEPRARQPLLTTPSAESTPRFSPNGRWLAYQSDESGRNEIYVRPFPGLAPKIRISIDGGTDPVWGRDGREILFRTGDKLIAVAVADDPKGSIARPTVVFEGSLASYDIASDGRILATRTTASSVSGFIFVQNWLEELKLVQ